MLCKRRIRCLWFAFLAITAWSSPPKVSSFYLNQQIDHSGEQVSNNEKLTDQHQTHNSHPSLFVDTKYWIKDTELAERANWLNHKRPCTLQLDKIVLGEQDDESMVVSMGYFYGPLESNTREIVLNQDGVILLESDQEPVDRVLTEADVHSMSDQKLVDASFVQYLNEIGECVDKLDTGSDSENHQQYFLFQPHPDDLSWFNPENWLSTIIDLDENTDWAPHSHQIPCTEDIVSLAGHHQALMTFLEGNEKSPILSFKVNFRPSQAMQQELLGNSSVGDLRIAKLKIGERSYSQKDLEQLISIYGDSLIEFGGKSSLLSYSNINTMNNRLPLTIDETSIQSGSEFDLCLEEAGCMCGNERQEIMKAICSFYEPLVFPDDYPCLDPILSTGYCDKICATVMTIQMNPNEFSERFITDLINKLLEEKDSHGEPQFKEHLFSGARRVDHAKYEITFRLVPTDASNYERSLGKDLEFAKLLKERLEAPATKSFYGIKKIRITSSTQWRTDNRWLVFSISLCLLAPLFASISLYEDRLLRSKSSTLSRIISSTHSQQQTHRNETLSFSSEDNILLMEPDTGSFVERGEVVRLEVASLVDMNDSVENSHVNQLE